MLVSCICPDQPQQSKLSYSKNMIFKSKQQPTRSHKHQDRPPQSVVPLNIDLNPKDVP